MTPRSKHNIETGAKVVKESFRKVQTNSFQKVSKISTLKRIEAWKYYLTQKIAAPNLFSLTKQLYILSLWYHFEQ